MATHVEYTPATVGEAPALVETVFLVSAAIRDDVTRSSKWWTPSLMAISKMGPGILRPKTGP